MIHRLELKRFKCFFALDLSLGPMSVLAGVNAAGKSSVLQSIVLFHQALAEAGRFGVWSNTLALSGPLLTLGTAADVINQDLGGSTFEIAFTHDSAFRIGWTFSAAGDRKALAVHVDEVAWSPPSGRAEQQLLPTAAGEAGRALIEDLVSLRYVPADRVGSAETYPLVEVTRHDSMGPRADRAVGTLYWHGRDPVDPKLRHPDPSVTPPLVEQVDAWLRNMFPGVHLEVSALHNANLVTLGVRTRDSNDFHRPHNVGFGITYALPIVVALLARGPHGVVIIENPEAHLHPRAQVQIATLACRFVAAGGQVIIETHSDHVLNAIRVAVARERLAAGEVAIHWFEPAPETGLIEPRRIEVDRRGRLSERPEGFFDEIDRQLQQLLEE